MGTFRTAREGGLLGRLARWRARVNLFLSRFKVTCRIATIVAYLLVGTAVATASDEDLSFIDGLYFSIVTISTVGYGDIEPESAQFRVFTIVYILVGCGYIFVLLSQLLQNSIESFRQRALALVGRLFDKSTIRVRPSTNSDGSKVIGRSKGLSGRGVDLSGDGEADFFYPPGPLTFWAQELLPAALLWVFLQLGSAAVFVQIQSDLDFGTALYHCLVTATTVGYGDVALHTQAARAWACLHILVSVSWLAALYGQVDKCQHLRDAQLDRAVLLTRPLERRQILGVELCGEPLKWDDVRPFVAKFDELDTARVGKISQKDLDTFYQQDVEEHARRMEKMQWDDEAIHRAQLHFVESVIDDARFVATRMGASPNEIESLGLEPPAPGDSVSWADNWRKMQTLTKDACKEVMRRRSVVTALQEKSTWAARTRSLSHDTDREEPPVQVEPDAEIEELAED